MPIEADKDIAEHDPECLPMPVRHGIAPAMKANGTTTYWGTEVEEENKYTEKTFRFLGGCKENEIKAEIREEMQKLQTYIIAREYVQYKVGEGGKSELPVPYHEESMPPEEPNAYTDGSLHNPTSRHWQVGGMGIFWPDRHLADEPMESHELVYLQSQESSRRCTEEDQS